MTHFWFILAALFIILELTNPGLFFFLSLSLAALITMFAQLHDCAGNEYVVFFVSTGIMFGMLQLLVKLIQKHKPSKKYQSNTQLLIGKTIKIVQVVSSDTGYGKVDGEIWSIKLQHAQQPLEVGMHGIITGVKGCHLQITLLKS